MTKKQIVATLRQLEATGARQWDLAELAADIDLDIKGPAELGALLVTEGACRSPSEAAYIVRVLGKHGVL